jgi:DNA-binding CsgD family transcriptional regulator/tetratricopeptide (TPR) repeat protein
MITTGLSVPCGMLEGVALRTVRAAFVGRDAELGRLRDALERAQLGEATVAVVGGEAGVGKSRLVDELAELARAGGHTVLRGDCVELGGEGLPFAPFVAMLRDLLRQRGPAAFAGYEGDFARLVPELGPVDDEPAARTGRGHLFDLVTGLFERLAVGSGGAVVLVAEDLHWADRSTRDLIAYLSRALRSARVLLVGTYRSDELHRGHPLRPFLAELDRVRGVDRLELERLDRESTGRILTGILSAAPSAATLDSIHGRSQGNPFFVEELAACAADCGLPDTLRDLLLAKVDRLAEADQRVLRTAAAGGRRLAYRLLAQVAGVPEPDLEESLRAALAAQLVVVAPDGDGYEFRHALVREVLHDELLPGEHARLHARYAAAIEADPSLVGESRAPAELAYHWHSAHDHPRALAAAVRAAASASHRYAFAEQLRLLDRVLELWEQVPDAAEAAGMDHLTVLETALFAARSAADYPRALKLVRAALAEVDEAAEPIRAAQLWEFYGSRLRDLGKGDGTEEMRRAYRLVEELPDTVELAELLANVASSLTLVGEHGEAERLAARAIAMAADHPGTSAHVRATVAMGMVCNNEVSAEAALTALHEALRMAGEGGDGPQLAHARVNLSDVLHELGQYAEAAEVARLGQADAKRTGASRGTHLFLRANHAEALIALGEWDAADEECGKIIRWAPPGALGLLGLVHRAFLRLARGDESAAEWVDRSLTHMSRAYLPSQQRLPLHELHIEATLAAGHPDTAVHHARTALSDPLLHRAPRYAWPLLSAASRAALTTSPTSATGSPATTSTPAPAGTPSDAGSPRSELVARLRELSASLPARYPYERACAADLAADLAALDRSDTPAVLAARAAAVAAWRADGHPYSLARALLGLAEAAAATGDRAAAEAAIEEATGIARRLGAEPVRERAALLARRLGVRAAPTAAPPAAAVLTDRELEVLRLVAEGHSNRRIAETLYISPKTASVHVSHIIAKLSVSGRGEAAAVAHRLGILDSPQPLDPAKTPDPA